jgi:hypothetical protein
MARRTRPSRASRSALVLTSLSALSAEATSDLSLSSRELVDASRSLSDETSFCSEACAHPINININGTEERKPNKQTGER